MKQFLGGKDVVSKLIALEPRQVSFESQLAVQHIVEQKPRSFDHNTIRRYSIAMAPFAALVRAFLVCWAA